MVLMSTSFLVLLIWDGTVIKGASNPFCLTAITRRSMPRQGGRDRHQLLLLLLPFLLLRQGGKDRLEDHSIWTLPNPLESESGDEAMLSNQIVGYLLFDRDSGTSGFRSPLSIRNSDICNRLWIANSAFSVPMRSKGRNLSISRYDIAQSILYADYKKR